MSLKARTWKTNPQFTSYDISKGYRHIAHKFYEKTTKTKKF
jgi:hypothetical protein